MLASWADLAGLEKVKSAFDELIAITPDAVFSVAAGDDVGILGVPHVLGEFELADGRFFGEGGFDICHLG